jgi:hypothetical protein
MDKPVLDIHIREDDPRFCQALGLANEVVAALVYGVVEPARDGTVRLPTFSAAINELNDDRDGVLTWMFVFALARTARNLARALELERGSTPTEVLQDFLIPPLQ